MDANAARWNMSTQSDLDLVNRHRYGDAAAFDEVYERFGVMVFNLALRMTGDPDEAADLSQETFLKIHRYLAGFRGRSSLRTWVYRVTINCCRTRYRRQESWRRRRDTGQTERLEQLPDRQRSPEERAMARNVGDRVGAALARLPAVYREVVVLRDIEGLTYREIATVAGLRIGTVRSRLARGRDRLRALLEEGR